MEATPRTVTQLLHAWGSGEPEALDQLFAKIYNDLHELAASQMRREQRPNHTLQTTELVNEYFLRLVAAKQVDWEDRTHFFGIAARIMRQVLVDHARNRGRLKRRGEKETITDSLPDPDGGIFDLDEVIALNEALERLEAKDPDQVKIVELRYFVGRTIEESAEILKISPATVKREWTIARAWLRRELG